MTTKDFISGLVTPIVIVTATLSYAAMIFSGPLAQKLPLGIGYGLISAGVYVFKRAVLEHIPDGPASLERDVFPQLLNEGMFALQQEGMFIDIGTPEDYARAQALCRGLQEAAIGRSR